MILRSFLKIMNLLNKLYNWHLVSKDQGIKIDIYPKKLTYLLCILNIGLFLNYKQHSFTHKSRIWFHLVLCYLDMSQHKNYLQNKNHFYKKSIEKMKYTLDTQKDIEHIYYYQKKIQGNMERTHHQLVDLMNKINNGFGYKLCNLRIQKCNGHKFTHQE